MLRHKDATRIYSCLPLTSVRAASRLLRVRVLFQNADPLAHVYPVNLLFYDAFLHFTKLPVGVRVSLYIIGQTWTIVY